MYHTYVNVDYRKIAVGISIAMLLATMLFAAMPVALAHPPQSDCANDRADRSNNEGTERAHQLAVGGPQGGKAQGLTNDACP